MAKKKKTGQDGINETPSRPVQKEIANDRIFRVATQYAEVAELVFNSFNLITGQYLLPFFMVGSFALELYLKALNSQEVAHPIEESDEAWTWFEQQKTKGVIWEQLSDEALKQGHDLLVLYDAIEESIRRELSEVYHNSPALENIGSVREALGVYATVFVDLRYAYEHGKSIPQRPLRDLLNLVKLVGQFVASKNDRGKFLEKMWLPNKREGTE